MFHFLTATADPGLATAGLGGTVFMLIGMFALMYFVMIRPENKRKKEAEQMRAALKVGDNITTIGGVTGKVVSIKDDKFVIESGADQVRIEFAKWALSTNNTAAAAAAEAKKNGTLCFGPYAADGFFGTEHFRKFDGVLAMYHDQGLAPFKALAMENGVNYTAGLPYVRTSPDHGTAYDIAGKGIASEESFRQAIYTALDVFRNRISDDEAHASPLRRQYVDKSGDREVLDLTADDEQ